MVGCNALTHDLVEPFSLTMVNLDSNVSGPRVGENNTPQFSLHWHLYGEWILPIVTSFVDISSVSIINAVLRGVQDPSLTIRERWGCQEEPTGKGHLHARIFTPIFTI
jgi:hypothetical protein